LSPIDEENGENDSSWLHRILSNCKGSEEKMLDVLNEIRGDFAIILIEGDQVFIMKDYFGKRSLLVGMSDDHLVISSIPV
jgi:asparagine synthetase B (glutamine-hydrolysing)